MISIEQALKQLTTTADLLARSEAVALNRSLGRTLSRDIVAPIDVPPADNSAMDGYAVCAGNWNDAALPLSQRIPAGVQPLPLQPGTAARIFTGAVIPQGADAVVMQENCRTEDDGVRILQPPSPADNIRKRGQDIRAGSVVLRQGQRLRPQDLGLIASLGIPRIQCYRPLKVAVISTGDELVQPGETAQVGQIYNSNRYTIQAQLQSWGFNSLDFGVAPDQPKEIRQLLAQAAEQADVIVSSGGVSVGEEDHVRAAVEALGALNLWKVRIKPGKPFAFGRVGDTPFLGLPGNPGAVWVTLLLLVRPFLFISQGRSDHVLQGQRQAALFRRMAGSRQEYLRARLEAGGVNIYPNQSSGVLQSAVWGDGLVVQEIGQDIEPGDSVIYLPYSELD